MAFFTFGPACCQMPGQPAEPEQDVKLPSGKSQREEILKADYGSAKQELDQLLKLAGDLKAELDKNDYHVLSIPSLKKLDEIEKLTRKIKGKLRR